MVTKTKKIIVLSVMMGLLVLTGFLNVTLNQKSNDVIYTGGNNTSTSFFTSYKTERDSARAQEKLYYTAILESAGSSASAKAAAEETLNNLAAKIESELYLESNIKAIGFADVVVSMTENFINVMVKGDKLTENETANIVSIVKEQTKFKDIDNIKVLSVE